MRAATPPFPDMASCPTETTYHSKPNNLCTLQMSLRTPVINQNSTMSVQFLAENNNLDLLRTKCRSCLCVLSMPSLLKTQMPTQGPQQCVRAPLKTFCAPPLTPQEGRTTKRKGKQNRAPYARWPLATRAVNTTTHYLITSYTTEKTNTYVI